MSLLRHLRNLAVGIHRNGVAVSYLVTLSPLAYPITAPLVTPLVVAVFLLDPQEFEEELRR